MAKMINTKYGYITPQEVEMDARLDKWYRDKKRREKKHAKDNQLHLKNSNDTKVT
ncbi:hypothetical protein [Pediococcus pentosaceus]|uniref:hypothetical protein n=1 Tax=Pediococcus pentosaceus TaxID=1255 RepID=UPI00207365BD|nr:hypothetical protein [Pediococcus pentosaceus]MCM6820030.1 hypothetical protein [Pediococcus pentosaceus]